MKIKIEINAFSKQWFKFKFDYSFEIRLRVKKKSSEPQFAYFYKFRGSPKRMLVFSLTGA